VAVELTKFEEHLFAQARQGNLNAFSSHFFRLPHSGTRYTPEDRVEDYEVLHTLWQEQGKHDKEFSVRAGTRDMAYRVEWDQYYSGYPVFLMPHGYLFLPWALEALTSNVDILIAEGGTGSAKTSTVGISGIISCALYPGAAILNVAPTQHQATDMLDEITKWVEQSEFRKFVKLTLGKQLFSHKPFPIMRIDVYGIESTFGCMTLGTHGNFVLGKDKDRVSCDEAGLVMGLDAEQPKLVTRMRGTRPTGQPRGVAPNVLFISNPHPGNFGWDSLKDKAKKRMQDKERRIRWMYVQPATEQNVYITNRQMELQREFLDEEQIQRWHMGSDEMFKTQGVIPEVGINECHHPGLDDALEELRDSGGPYEYRDGMGCIHYEFPPNDDKTWRYLAWGDPGTANATARANNVPTAGVLDIQGWPRRPATLVAFRMIDGGGKYNAWVTEIARLIIKYRCVMGAYDATGYGKSFEEWPELEQLPLFPVNLAGGNKATSRTSFNLFAGNGLFAWPRVEPIWAQANAYRETGPGVHAIPDDVISGLFVATFYLRYEFWEELTKMFPHLTGDQRPEKFERTGDAPKKKRRARYGRRGSRYRTSRRRKEDPYVVPE
jgi:hypothetical protein